MSQVVIWAWVARGRGGVLADTVSIFKKAPKVSYHADDGAVRWDDPDDRITNPNRLCFSPGDFYQWFGFTPEPGSCELYKLGMKEHLVNTEAQTDPVVGP